MARKRKRLGGGVTVPASAPSGPSAVLILPAAEPEPTSSSRAVSFYLGVTVVLLALLGVTVGAAYLDLGGWNTPVALAIAAVKAAVIATCFMHLRQAAGLQKIFAAAGLFWLTILFGLSLCDFLSR